MMYLYLYRILAKSKDTDENPKPGKGCINPKKNSFSVSSHPFFRSCSFRQAYLLQRSFAFCGFFNQFLKFYI